MANHFPDSADAKVTGVQYGMTLTDNVACTGGMVQSVSIPAPLVSFSFEWSYDGSGDLQVTYGGFDQDEAEAGYSALLNFMMTTLGIDLADWSAKVRVQRFWTFYPVTKGSVLQVSGQDLMPYTAAELST
jgi:hypothetical protein